MLYADVQIIEQPLTNANPQLTFVFLLLCQQRSQRKNKHYSSRNNYSSVEDVDADCNLSEGIKTNLVNDNDYHSLPLSSLENCSFVSLLSLYFWSEAKNKS